MKTLKNTMKDLKVQLPPGSDIHHTSASLNEIRITHVYEEFVVKA